MKKKLALIMLGILAVSALGGCSTYTNEPVKSTEAATSATESASGDSSKETEASSSNQPKVMTVGASADVITLDCSKANDNNSSEVLFHTSEGLLRYYEGEIRNGLAESYEVSEDGLTYTFHLRDAKWEDGEPVTADQFVYSFQRLFDPGTGASQYDLYLAINNAQDIIDGKITDLSQLGVEAVDEKTFVITLGRISPTFLDSLAAADELYPLRQEFVEAAGAAYGSDKANYLSTGPFKLESWTPETEVVMVKNDNYWAADSIHMDRITRLIIADANTRASMFDNGEIDVNNNIASSLLGNYDNETCLTYSSGTMYSLQINVNGTSEATGKVLSNENFRKALSYAIDRQAIGQAIEYGSNTPAGRLVDPAVPGTTEGKSFHEEFSLSNEIPVKGDAAKAKEYLDKALEELGMTAQELPTMTYLCMDIGNRKLYAEAILSAWNTNLGISCFEVVQFPVPTTIQNMMNGEYDIYWQQVSNSLMDPYTYMCNWVTDGGINVTGWGDETYDTLIDKTEATMDQAQRLQLFAQAEDYILEHGPQIPLFFGNNNISVNPSYTGVSYLSDMTYIYADVSQ